MSDDPKLIEDCLAVAHAMQRQIQKTFPDFELPLIKQLEALRELQPKL